MRAKVRTAQLREVAYTEKSAGTFSFGGSMSFTVTVCTADALLPEASVAVQVIVVTPTLYGASIARPSLRTLETWTPGQLSVATGEPTATTAVARPGSLPTVILAGAVIDGFTVSFVLAREKRIASFERLKKPFTRGLQTPVTAFWTLSYFASVPTRFSMPCVTRWLVLVTVIQLV